MFFNSFMCRVDGGEPRWSCGWHWTFQHIPRNWGCHTRVNAATRTGSCQKVDYFYCQHLFGHQGYCFWKASDSSFNFIPTQHTGLPIACDLLRTNSTVAVTAQIVFLYIFKYHYSPSETIVQTLIPFHLLMIVMHVFCMKKNVSIKQIINVQFVLNTILGYEFGGFRVYPNLSNVSMLWKPKNECKSVATDN